MPLLQRYSPLRDWLDLARASNLPTIVTHCLLGVGMALMLDGDSISWWPLTSATALWPIIATTIGMCALYTAGMVLNGIVDRDVDARERPLRPIAAGRIRLPWAWTAFIALMFLGFALRPTFAAAPIPIAVAALIGVWSMNWADSMRSLMLRKLAKAWCLIAVIAAIWWAIDMVIKDPFDLTGFEEMNQRGIRAGQLALNLPTLMIAISLVAYNLLHKRTAWSIVFLAVCRFLVPIAVMMAIIVPSGFLAVKLNEVQFNRVPWVEISLILVIPLALALHTIMLSFVARREVSAEGATYRCARCNYRLINPSIANCPECGSALVDVPPIGDRAISPRLRRASFFLPCIACVVPVFFFVQSMIRGTFELTNIAIFAIAAVMFCITSTRAFRAALSHPSRRPAGIAALIAAFALLDASLLAAISAPFLATTCIALWFVTRWVQKQIPGS